MRDFPVATVSCPAEPNPFEIVPQLCPMLKNELFRRIEARFDRFLVIIWLILTLYVMIRCWYILLCYIKEYIWYSEGPEVMDRRAADMRIYEELRNRREPCSICSLSPVRFPVITDCGHVFCCDCIIQRWRQRAHRACECVSCGNIFRRLIKFYWPIGVRHEYERNVNRMNVDTYNRRFSPDRTIQDRIQDFPSTLVHIIRHPPDAVWDELAFIEICMNTPAIRFVLSVLVIITWAYLFFQGYRGNGSNSEFYQITMMLD